MKADLAGGLQYIMDGDGIAPNMYWVIRRRTPGKKMDDWDIVAECKTATKSEVADRVATLNRGEPTRGDNQTWGKLTKERARPGRTVKDGGRNLGAGIVMPSPTECVERLVSGVIEKATDALALYQASGKGLSLKTLENLLQQVIEPHIWSAFCASSNYDKSIDAISRQLYLKFGISRANDRRG